MRKLIILICIAITGGALYALVPNLFPDTPSFPRTPTADGTIGGVLQKIVGGIISDATDGTVANTEKLDGVTATGYLKNNSCNIPDKWIGIDANGKAICGTSSPILADYGTVSEQGCDADIYHASGSTSKTSTGKILKAGDIVKTLDNPNCTLTIAFTDFSILRLDADTTVSLDVLAAPAPSTQTIASAILSNGSLWGRILTDTGSYSIGTDKIVAGVRGTSVAVVQTGVTITMGSYSSTTGKWPMTKVGTPSTPFLAIPHSQSSDNTISGDIGNATIKIGNSVAGPNMVNFTRNPVENLYQDSPWIRRNTANDLGYMYRLLSLSGTTLLNPIKIGTELTVSQPPNIPGDLEAGNLCESPQIWWNGRYGCQAPNILAQADYTLPEIGTSGPIAGVPQLYIKTASTVMPTSFTSPSAVAPIASPTTGLSGAVAYGGLSSILSGDWTMEIEVERSQLGRTTGTYQLLNLSDGVDKIQLYLGSGLLKLYSSYPSPVIATGAIPASIGRTKITLRKISSTYTINGVTMSPSSVTYSKTNTSVFIGSNTTGLQNWGGNIYSIKILN